MVNVKVSKSLYDRVRVADVEHVCCYCKGIIHKGEVYIVILNAPKGIYRGIKHAHLKCYCKIFNNRCKAIIEIIIRKYIMHNKSPDVEYFKNVINELCQVCKCCDNA